MTPTDLPIILAATIPTDGAISGSVQGLILYITMAIALSFLCSLLEAALLSTPNSFIQTEAQGGNRAATLMKEHKQNIDGPITSILTLNTFAHTFGAAGAGAEAVGVFGSQWASLITVIMTLLILIFSEIIPKTVGAVYWKQLFNFAAYTIKVMVIVFYPAVWAFNYLTRIIAPDNERPTITRRELEMMAQISATEGSLEKSESRIVTNLFRLSTVKVWDIMTPRTVMLAFPRNLTVDEILDNGQRSMPYSRIPIYNETSDNITGFVLRHDIFRAAASDKHDTPLHTLERPIHFVPETMTVTKVLEEFVARQQHIFVVFDEYGGTAGIITMEDAVESLLGIEITDESDVVADLRQLAQQRYERQQDLIQTAKVVPALTAPKPDNKSLSSGASE
ncbi:MAG: hemolysin family protein [Phototrophicales bacterium]|nr:hemolysin family protein [Phototrophicales bacterium]